MMNSNSHPLISSLIQKLRIQKFIFLLIFCFPFSVIAQNPMQLQYNTNLSAGTTIGVPLGSGVNVNIDWGDGVVENNITTIGQKTHTYSSEGSYTVSISGSL